jgi:hypothetical protein
MDEFGHRARIKAEALFGDHGNEAGAGFEIGIVKFAIALILLEVGGVGGGKKRALVMIEPPGDFGRAGVFEIYDGIFVAVELILVEERAGPMKQAGVHKLDVAADALSVETGEQGGGAGSVKTLVVIKDSDSQSDFPSGFYGLVVKNN